MHSIILFADIKDLIKQKDIKKVTSEFSVPHMSEESYRYKKDLGGGSYLIYEFTRYLWH